MISAIGWKVLLFLLRRKTDLRVNRVPSRLCATRQKPTRVLNDDIGPFISI